MSAKRDSYHRILGAVSVIGGTQLFSIFVSLLRTKVVAALIGPVGVGIVGLFNSSLGVLGILSSFGLESVGVKYISEPEPEISLPKRFAIIDRIGWITATLGALLTIAFSGLLSQITFDTTDFTFGFILLSASVFFKQLTTSRLAFLQGMRRMRKLAMVNLYGNIGGFIVSVPLYFQMGREGIVPAFVIGSLVMLLIVFMLTRSELPAREKVSPVEFTSERKKLMQLSAMFSFNTIVSALSIYLLQIFVTNQSDITQTGLYVAATTLLNTYVGVLFTAMGTDYFPRLNNQIGDTKETNAVVNQQVSIGILLITPLVLLFLCFAPVVMSLFFSEAFMGAIPLAVYGMFGMLFRVVSYSVGYLILAKAEKKVFLFTTMVFNILFVGFGILGYVVGGLSGLGISFAGYYVIHLIGVTIITSKRYGFSFSADAVKLFAICLAFCLSAYICSEVLLGNRRILALVIITASALFYCFFQMEERTGFLKIIRKKINF